MLNVEYIIIIDLVGYKMEIVFYLISIIIIGIILAILAILVIGFWRF